MTSYKTSYKIHTLADVAIHAIDSATPATLHFDTVDKTMYCISANSFLPWIRMQYWRRPVTDGAEFWISCKQPAFLSSFSPLQVIQNKRPSYSHIDFSTIIIILKIQF